MPNFIDHTNKTFGRLTVLSFSHMDNFGHSVWFCQCSCGTIKTIIGDCLKRGTTLSCGCLALERQKAANVKHGKSHYREYDVWAAMVQRCTRLTHPSYADYGGRGITVCERWLSSIDTFLEDIGRRPSDRHSLNRIDNDGNYEPKNCEWTTRDVQSRNMRSNRYLTFQGMSLIMKDWATHLGMNYGTLRARFRYGWSVERALSTPTYKHDNPSVRP